MKYNIYYEKAMLFDKILIIINGMLEQGIKKGFIAEKLGLSPCLYTRFMKGENDVRLKTLQKYYNLIK